jgi:hypothetical protein
MKINAFLVAMGIGAAALVGVPTAQAVPSMVNGIYCEANPITTVLFCDRPMQPDGSWIRCYGFYPFAAYGDYSSIGVGNNCYRYDPAAPPSLPIGQPNHHIDS